ncbi:MAG TPA: Spy/CpxP family protein refolding chaperone [Steroidobacteraceae bacterium]|nr:Spy/CpxP family protein refolding chaperone [Steroidobacteraceae bacterium]
MHVLTSGAGVLAALAVLATSGVTCAQNPSTSPYVAQQTRDIKSLSAADIDAYLSGKGMGLARAAELNGYAGPAHVLELASQLTLTPTQRVDSQALFDSMQERARALGRELVDEERTLDGLFANGTVTPQLLENSLARIASLQARLRGTHLEAHLAQASILTPEQNAHYAQLRGYGGAPEHGDHGGR